MAGKMGGEIEKRLALLSILLVAALAAAGIVTASGASDLLKPAGKEVKIVEEVVVMNGEQIRKIRIFEDGKLLKELPVSGEYIIETSGYKIVFHKITQEDIEKSRAEHEKEMNEWLKIVNSDSRIQELTNGEGIQLEDVLWAKSNGYEVILTVNIGGKYYKVTIDLNNETVKSVEEQS